jgi:hypothetical protein
MRDGTQSWLVAGASFGTALLLGVLAHPPAGHAMRRPAQATGEACCHITAFAPGDNVEVTLQAREFLGIVGWNIELFLSGDGSIHVNGSAINGSVQVAELKNTSELFLVRARKESCRHEAKVEGEIEARWHYDQPSSASVGPFDINATGCHVKTRVHARVQSDLGDPEDHDVEEEIKIHNTRDFSIAANLGKDPSSTVQFSTTEGKADSDSDDADLERTFFPFDKQIKMRVQSTMKFRVVASSSVASISATGLALVKKPFLTDRDEPVHVGFKSDLFRDQITDKHDCHSPELTLDVPPNEKLAKQLAKSIGQSAKPKR